MSLKINQTTNRLTKEELLDYKENSGITELQFEIIKKRYFDANEPTVTAICMDLCISQKKYNRELNRALRQIYIYDNNAKKTE